MTKKILAVIVISLILFNNTYAQNAIIKGQVVDSSVNANLKNASVVLLEAKDSFIVADARADAEGRFSFTNLYDTTSYVLFFSYPKYADYSHKISMKDAVNGVLDMNKVVLILKEKLLQEVVVKSNLGAIRIKGDTTEYVADSFKVQPNANVEDLLKQLPGLQVDQYGNITAQGQKVKKVLVDGEEFFSDDPTLVTRNLRADMIDKVQVFDKKSDAAAFTGIDDGVRDKTINLKIKEDKNHGIFGKAEAGVGTDKHYNAQGMLNAFKGKRKMAVYGTASNIGRTGLGSADKEKIGDTEDGNGTYDGKGLPKVISGGLHYDKKWSADKNDINANYKFNNTHVSGTDNTISQNNLESGTILSNSTNVFDNRSTSNRANATYTHKFDTTSTVKIYSDGNISNSKNLSNTVAETRAGNNQLINDNQSSGDNDYDYNTYNVNLSWEKKLKKYGRTISFYLNNNLFSDKSVGNSRSIARFYDEANSVDSTGELHLKRQMNDDSRTLRFNTNYTEPLSSKLSLILNYTLDNNVVHDDKRSYNLIASPSATLMDTSFSSLMNSTIWGNQGGVALNYSTKKTILKVGNNVKVVNMDIDNLLSESKISKQFLNWNPQATYNHKFTTYKVLDINYLGNSINPDRTQLMPYNYNNSQLVTYMPNSYLKNSFSNDITLDYRTAKIVSQTYAGVHGSYNLTNNPIALAMDVDRTSGTYLYQFENMSGYNNANYNIYGYYSKKIQNLDMQSGAWGSFSGGTMYSRIDNAVNKLNYKTYSLGLNFYTSKVKKYEAYLSPTGGYTINNSSLQKELKNNYFYFSIYSGADVYFLKKFQLHNDANYFWQQKTQTFNDNFDRLIWNAWLGYNMLKNDQLTIKVSCNDILNQNNGYSRTANNTMYTENRYTTIRRFFMIGATWSFTKFNNIKQ